MTDFTLVTGNIHKVAEYRRLLTSQVEFEVASIDLEELQSLDSRIIIEHKARQAYDRLHQPVIVEDISAGIDRLKGLPGPFIKFFEQRLGKNALYQLAGEETPATVTCTIGYFDGRALVYAEGEVRGVVVEARGTSGFGFDFCFRPNGKMQTFAEMGAAKKDTISHRFLAIQELLKYLGK